jgi:hypothetical protein
VIDDPDRCGTVRTGFFLGDGGHPPALVVRADGSAAYHATDGGALVGILVEPRLVDLGTFAEVDDGVAVIVLSVDGAASRSQ